MLEDCIALCGVDGQEVAAIAEHEHIPETRQLRARNTSFMSVTGPDPGNAEKQFASACYRLPDLDQDSLLGDSVHGVRFLLEYAKGQEAERRSRPARPRRSRLCWSTKITGAP